MFYCDYICSRYKCFNYELEQTTRKIEASSNEQEVLEKLDSLKLLDLELTELLLLTRVYFKKMLLLTITSDVIVMVVDIYWIYGGFIYGDNPFFLRKYRKVKTYETFF